ncbi:hypothetical protein ALISP_5560 [Alicycliphilus sp. B1]|nr:hypothetical protein ALISP_5560 [Alicycliphilus sp. B1]
MQAEPGHAFGPALEGRAVLHVAHDHRAAAAQAHAGRALAAILLRRPAQLHMLQVLPGGPGMRHDLDALARVVARHAHPAHAVAADLHGRAAHGVQQVGLAGGAHQRLAAGAAQALGPVQARQLLLDAVALGDVVGQYLPCGAAVELRVADEDLHVDARAVLAHVVPDGGRERRGAGGPLVGAHGHGAVSLVPVFRRPEHAHVHARQLVRVVAVLPRHGVVGEQQAQAVAFADPHGLGVLGKQAAVLPLGGAQLAVHAAQLHHRAQGFGQHVQVPQVARREALARRRDHLQHAGQQRARAQRHGDEVAGRRAFLRVLHMVGGHVAGLARQLLQAPPQRLGGLWRGPGRFARAGLHVQRRLPAQRDHGPRRPCDLAGGARRLLQHLLQGLLQVGDALLHAQQVRVGQSLFLRLPLHELDGADVGHAAGPGVMRRPVPGGGCKKREPAAMLFLFRACSKSFHGARCLAWGSAARRTPQPGWWPGEDLQRRRRASSEATLRAWQQTATLVVAPLAQAASMGCGGRLDRDGLLPCGLHEKTLNRL